MRFVQRAYQWFMPRGYLQRLPTLARLTRSVRLMTGRSRKPPVRSDTPLPGDIMFIDG